MSDDIEVDGSDEHGHEQRSRERVVVIERTGFPPVRFSKADLITEGSTLSDKKDDRGFRIRIYRAGPKCVAHIEYLTKWKSEANASTVYICRRGGDLARKVLAHDPMQFVVGYPPGERFDEKRHRLESTLRNQYLSLASRLLTALPEAAEDIGDGAT